MITLIASLVLLVVASIGRVVWSFKLPYKMVSFEGVV